MARDPLILCIQHHHMRRSVMPNARIYAVLWTAIAGALLLIVVPFACARRTTDPQPEATKNAAPLVAASAQGRTAALLGGNGDVIAAVAERALPSVVSVASTRVSRVETPELPFGGPDLRRFFGPGSPFQLPFPLPEGNLGQPPPEQRGLGSGVIVAKNVILTNAHVVEDATELVVTTGDRRVLKSELVGSDPKSDLAVLRITGDTNGITPIEFGDSDKARLGNVVLAIGNPFGVGQTVTMGIISARQRADLGIVDYEDFIQTDAAINPGNSGGALVDMEGKLLGIPTAILSRTGGYMGVGFAVPSNMAKPIMTSLLEHGRVARSYLGVSIQPLDPELATALGVPGTDGVLVSDVSPNGPAAKAGVKRGDIIVSIDGNAMRTTGQLRNFVAAAGIGKNVNVDVLRAGKRETITVKLAEMPGDAAQPATGSARATPPATKAAGISVAPLDDTMRKRLRVPADIRQGVVVTDVDPNTPAARAGLRPGDVILELNKEAIDSPQRLNGAWQKSTGPAPVLIYRDGRTLYAVIKQ
jgi:serine protease Do